MITIVLPVYNGGDFLRRCLESLARQDSGPGTFELVVLDSCSTDGGLEALRLLPEWIPRRVVRSERLLPIEQNWARINELREVGEFMTMIGHDDMLDPGFIRIMSRALREEPDIGLLLAHFRLIDAEDKTIRACHPMAPRETAAHFLAGRLARIRDSFGTGYVFRSADYQAAGGIPLYPKLIFADDALWIRLAARGGIRILEEECFSYRLHASNTSRVTDSALLLRAFTEYLDFLERVSQSDPALLRAMTIYGPDFVRSFGIKSVWEEATRANRAHELVRADAIDGWRAVWRRFLSIVGQTDLTWQDPREVALSLWANKEPLRRRLWAARPSRVLMRGLLKVTGFEPGGPEVGDAPGTSNPRAPRARP